MLSRSALMTAASEGHISIVRLFLQHNANTELKDSQGWKASDHAVIHGHHRLGRHDFFWHRDTTSKWRCCCLVVGEPHSWLSGPGLNVGLDLAWTLRLILTWMYFLLNLTLEHVEDSQCEWEKKLAIYM